MGVSMRKKSHISLANYLLESMNIDELFKYKKSFYLGSILPDCLPSFLTQRHTIDETFDILRNEILKITDEYEKEKGFTRYYSRHLGVVTHYIADYFTYPHNHVFTGNMKEHCKYENKLKFALREYVKKEETMKERSKEAVLRTVDDILDFIKEMHGEYLKVAEKVKMDCTYIVDICHQVVDAILQILELGLDSAGLGHMKVA